MNYTCKLISCAKSSYSSKPKNLESSMNSMRYQEEEEEHKSFRGQAEEHRRGRRRKRRGRRRRILQEDVSSSFQSRQKFLMILITSSLLSTYLELPVKIEATSQISASYWLPANDAQQHPRAANYQFQASSSSLQPMITSLESSATQSVHDSDLDNHAGISTERRVDHYAGEPTNSLHQFNNNNISNEASSQLDHLWLVNQTNNAGVHFDEEQQQQQQQQQHLSPHQQFTRRQDLNETSTIFPQVGAEEGNEEAGQQQQNSTTTSASPLLDTYDPPIPVLNHNNYGVSATNAAYNNQSLIYYTPKVESSPPSTSTVNAIEIRWPHKSASSSRQSPTSSPSNDLADSINLIAGQNNENNGYRQRDKSSNGNKMAADDIDVVTTYAAMQPELNTPHDRQSQVQSLNNNHQQPTVTLTGWPNNLQVPADQQLPMLNLNLQTSNGLRGYHLNEAQYMSSLQQHRLAQQLQLEHDFNQLRNKKYRFPPAKRFQFYNNNFYGEPKQLRSSRPFGTRREAAQVWLPNKQVILPVSSRSREASANFAGSSANNLFLRPFVYSNSAGNNHQRQKPKKSSLLSSLGSKINSWVDPEASKVQKLEETFWNEEQQRRRRNKWLKSANQAQWQKANFYLIEQPGAKGFYRPAAGSFPSSQVARAKGPRPYQVTQNPLDSTLTFYPPSFYAAVGGVGVPTYFPPPGQAGLVHQARVAPATSSLSRFYQQAASPLRARGYPTSRPPHGLIHESSSNQHLSQFVSGDGSQVMQQAKQSAHDDRVNSQPASFVPVVAVSVTKTSPAPTRTVQQQQENSLQQQVDEQQPASSSDSNGQQELNSELMDYLDLKTATKARQFQHLFDDYGSLPASSVSRDLALRQRPTAALPFSSLQQQQQQQPSTSGIGEHTTTVKSAVFGYFPHEAQKPILQAISMLPVSSGYPAAAANQQVSQPGTLLTLRNSIAGQQQQQQQHALGINHLASASDAFTHQLDQLDAHSQQMVPESASLIHEDTPSLLLQLQANNFAQNDIAHPFHSSPAARAYLAKGTVAPALMRAYSTPRGVAATALRAIDVYPTNEAQFHGFQLFEPEQLAAQAAIANPLLTGASDAQTAAHLLTSASDLLPAVPGHLFYGSAAESSNQQQANSEHQQQQLLHQQSSLGSVQDVGHQDEDGSSSDEQPRSQQVNKQGKKRSSEFFASAGQLLLNALPLLLAPTLGLMFASAPLPVARYQAPLNQHQTFLGSSSSMHSGIPGNYINSHMNNDGMVTAGSAAHLFTPNPPGYSTSTSARPAVVRPVGSRVQVQSAATAPPTSPPAVAILSARNRTINLATPSPQRLSVTLTTLEPAQEGAAHSVESIINPFTPSPQSISKNQIGANSSSVSNATSAHTAPEQHLHHHHHHVGNTILLLAGDIESTQPPVLASAISSNNDSHHLLTGSQYDLAGYDGADFDAQFASVRRNPPREENTRERISLDRNASAYELTSNELFMDTSSSPGENHRDRNRNRVHSSSSNNFRLYPLSTWPPMRRRTVSLVTSNGNKTYSDSSDKYTSSGSSDFLTRRNESLQLIVNNEQPQNNQSTNYSSLANLSSYRNQTELAPISSIDSISELLLREDAQHLTRSARSKRSIEPTNSSNSSLSRLPSRRIVRRKRVRRKLRGDHNDTFTGNETTVDPLKQDASRNKAAHIITTIVAQDDSDDGQQSTSTAANDAPKIHSNLRDEDTLSINLADEDLSSNLKLRELILKRKILLNRIAGQSDQIQAPRLTGGSGSIREPSSSPGVRHEEEASSVELAERNLSSLGRGRFPPSPIPIELTSTEIRLFPNGTSLHHHPSLQKRRLQNSLTASNQVPPPLILAEDTKRALMNFGSLLIKDTLQLPVGSSGTQTTNRNVKKKHRRPSRVSNNSLRRRERNEVDLWTVMSSSEGKSGDLLDTATERSVYQNNHPSFSGESNEFNNRDRDSLESDSGEDINVGLISEEPLRQSPVRGPTYPRSNSRSSEQRDLANSRSFHARSDRANLLETDGESPSYFGADERGPISTGMSNSGGHYSQSAPLSDALQQENFAPRERRLAGEQQGDFSRLQDTTYLDQRQSTDINDRSGYEPEKNHRQVNRDNLQPNYIYDLMMRRHHDGHHSASSNSNFSPGGDSPPVSGYSHNHHHHQQQQQQNRHPSRSSSDQYSYQMQASQQQYPPTPSESFNATTYAPNLNVPNHFTSAAQGDHISRQPPYHLPSSYGRFEPHDYQQANQNRFSADSTLSSTSSSLQNNLQQTNYSPASFSASPYNNYPATNDATTYQRDSMNFYSPTPPTRFPIPSIQRNFYQPETNNYSQQQIYQSGSPGSVSASATSDFLHQGGPLTNMSTASQQHEKSGDSQTVYNDYLKRVQFNDSDRDKLMASYLTCDGLLNDSDHCLERLACEFSDPQNIAQANKLDRAVSSILLGHILINTYIPNHFKFRLKSASLYGYTQSGKCSKFACNKLTKQVYSSTNNIEA